MSKSWSDAFKDPKVLIVCITLGITGLGSSITLLMDIGAMSAKVETLTTAVNDYKFEIDNSRTQINNLHSLIESISKKCLN